MNERRRGNQYIYIYIYIYILCVFFAGLSLAAVLSVRNILSFKYGDGILGMQYLYRQETDSIDVLILGSSHAFENVNTQILYDEYGTAGYVLAGSVQPFWNTYYYLQEALRTQTPRLIVLEGYAATKSYEYSDHSRIIKNTFGIRSLPTRWNALMVSSPPDLLGNYLFDYRLWHSRYQELNAADFPDYYEKPIYQYYKGFGINFNTTPAGAWEAAADGDEIPILEKEEIYFRKIIESCQESQIPVMVIVSPYSGYTQQHDGNYRYLQRITDEYGVPFVNFNNTDCLSAMDLDLRTDIADKDHLNYSGSAKFTRLLGKFIRDAVELPDRRNDKNYLSWTLHSKDILERIRDHEIQESKTADDFLKRLSGASDLQVYLYTVSDSDKIKKRSNLLKILGISESEFSDGQFYQIQIDDKTVTLLSDSRLCWSLYIELNHVFLEAVHTVALDQDGIHVQRSLSYNGKQYMNTENGCYLAVYNSFTKTLVCIRRIQTDDSGAVILANE